MSTIDVIYIEDEEAEGLLFTMGLKPRGINVLHIPDAEPDSLELLKTAPYTQARAVFFDMWIGASSGVDTAQALRDQGDTRPFFLVTAGNNPDAERLNKINLTYLQKPVSYAKVSEIIHNLE